VMAFRAPASVDGESPSAPANGAPGANLPPPTPTKIDLSGLPALVAGGSLWRLGAADAPALLPNDIIVRLGQEV